MYLKTLTLDYDYFDNEYFELSVINDATIELFHPSSGTVYEFRGRGYIQFIRSSGGTTTASKTSKAVKKRKQKTEKVDNPRENNRS
jgi:hypothetical protein